MCRTIDRTFPAHQRKTFGYPDLFNAQGVGVPGPGNSPSGLLDNPRLLCKVFLFSNPQKALRVLPTFPGFLLGHGSSLRGVLLFCAFHPLLLARPAPAASIGADALVLVNSRSAQFADFQHFIQPFLDNFGVPYMVQDISTNAPGTNLARYALIIIGHKQLDIAKTYLTTAAQSQISSAIS